MNHEQLYVILDLHPLAGLTTLTERFRTFFTILHGGGGIMLGLGLRLPMRSLFGPRMFQEAPPRHIKIHLVVLVHGGLHM